MLFGQNYRFRPEQERPEKSFRDSRKTVKPKNGLQGFFLITNDLHFDFVSFPGEQFRSSRETKLSKAMVQLASGVQPVAGVLEPVVGEQSEEGV